VVLVSRFTKPMPGCEIGLYVSKKIEKPVPSATKLQKHIDMVTPAMEIPELAFTDRTSQKDTDLFAENVRTALFINTPSLLPSRRSPGQRLRCPRRSTGSCPLAGKRRTQGRTILSGQVLFTGALGEMLPARPGSYTAEYGKLREISLQIRQHENTRKESLLRALSIQPFR